jgi:predicted nucleic acid-binding protein
MPNISNLSMKNVLILIHGYSTLVVPAFVEYEILRGEKNPIDAFWEQFFDKVGVLPFDRACARAAADIYAYLKPLNQHQQPLDILIAATARVWDYPIATLNTKDFEHIPGIKIV